MKLKNTLTALICLTVSTAAFAHCPSAFKEEKVCLMLDGNMVYIYDDKLEHNGPYKDFENAEVTAIKSPTGKNLEYKKLARGIYKFTSSTQEKSVSLDVTLGKKKQTIKVAHE